jgi:GxxExxY protein
MKKQCNQELMQSVLSAAYQIRQEFGPGLPESAYEFALVGELRKRGFQAERREVAERNMPVALRAGVLVENCLLLGLKCVDRITSLDSEQLSRYLRKWRFRQGLLLNFNSTLRHQGIHPVSL